MSNNLSPSFSEYWAAMAQKNIRKSLVSSMFANFGLAKNVNRGDTVHSAYFSDVEVDDHVRGADIFEQDFNATDETLKIDQEKATMVYVDDFDVIQSNYTLADKVIESQAYALKDQIDGKFFKEVLNANITMDDSDNGGNAGDPITLTKDNALDVLSTSWAKLQSYNVEDDRPWPIPMTPMIANIVNMAMKEKAFNLADTILRKGYTGDVLGYKTYISNNLTHSYKLTYSGQPSDTETITIDGVVFTFVSSLGTTAGNVLIGADAATTYANLANAINRGTGAGSAYVDMSITNARKFRRRNMSATQGSGYLRIYGAGAYVITESASNLTLGVRIVHLMPGKQGSVHEVLQAFPKVKIDPHPSRMGQNIKSATLFGIKTFKEGADRIMNLWIKG